MAELKPYPKYKDSGVEWIGEIPEDWGITYLKRLFKLVYRYPSYYGIDYVNNGVIEVRGEMLTGNGVIDINTVEPRYITLETSNEFPLTQLEIGDIVMSVRGTMGKIGLVNEKLIKSNITANLLRLSPNFDIVNAKFLQIIMESKRFIEELENHSDQTTIKTITVPNLLSIIVAIPELDIQNKIIDYVENKKLKIDSLITDKKHLMSLLEEKRQAIITETVTKGLDPDVKMKDSGIEWIGEIPEHWEVGLMRRIVDEIKDGTHSSHTRVSDGKPLLSAKNIQNNTIYISETESQISEEDHNEITKNGFPKKNDLLITIVGTIGRVCLYPYDFPLAFQRSVAFLRLNSKVYPEYYLYYTQTACYLDHLLSFAKTSAQAGVYMGDIMNTRVLMLPYEEQKRIADYLSNELNYYDETIDLITNQIQKIKEYRESLIYEAVTGKIDLREYEINSSEYTTYEQVAESDEAYMKSD